MSRDIKYIGTDVHKEAIVIAVLSVGGYFANYRFRPRGEFGFADISAAMNTADHHFDSQRVLTRVCRLQNS